MAATKHRRLWHSAYMLQWRKAHPELVAFHARRAGAKQRGIPFLMTFEEWWAIWQDSGKWEQRGCHRGQYVMARFRDAGPYAVGNVRICTREENSAEYFANISNETRRRISVVNKGRTFSEEWRRKLSEAQKTRQPPSEETRRRLSEAQKARIARNPGMMSAVSKGYKLKE